jgi:hypothetical protein
MAAYHVGTANVLQHFRGINTTPGRDPKSLSSIAGAPDDIPVRHFSAEGVALA